MSHSLRLRETLWSILLVALLCLTARAGDETPAWLRQAAAANTPAVDKDVPAVVLLDETKVTVGADGRVMTTNTYAVRVLNREGRRTARGREVYNTGSGKVREMRAWLIRPSGETKRYGKDETIDVAVVDNDVYNEARARVIDAEDDAEQGAVFGYEATTEERSVFTQFEWLFQHRLPVVVSRCSFTLPANWRAESLTFNRANIEPVVSGTTYSWELRDLPAIDPEPSGPEVTNLAPRLAVNVFPAAGAAQQAGKTFGNWADVSRWLSELSAGQDELDDPLAAKARDLTTNAKTELERIKAIGRYVQAVNYISIQTGVGRGGGYRPRPATEVFARSYGDCKDKANLMRAMLKAVRIQSYLLTIFSGDPTYVREQWASPQQFNHCIIAVKVSDETKGPTIVTHPTLGRFLIFDPTDESTPVGDLPDHEQGSLALLVAGQDGALLRMPVTPPEANQMERHVEFTLTPQGAISGVVREQGLGQSAVSARREFRYFSRPDYIKFIERRMARGAGGASVSGINPQDDHAEGKFSLHYEFKAEGYGQSMMSRLLVFRPAVISGRETVDVSSAQRKHAVILEPYAYRETTRVNLPAGYAVDEIPEATQLTAEFGNYSAAYEVKDNQLVFTRRLVVQSATIPAANYAAVRDFFGRVRAAEQAPVVLAKN